MGSGSRGDVGNEFHDPIVDPSSLVEGDCGWVRPPPEERFLWNTNIHFMRLRLGIIKNLPNATAHRCRKHYTTANGEEPRPKLGGKLHQPRHKYGRWTKTRSARANRIDGVHRPNIGPLYAPSKLNHEG